jgi:hypothetical protein
MTYLRHVVVHSLCLMFAAALFAQLRPEAEPERQTIARVRKLLVSKLEPGMPRVTLEYFLRSEAGAGATLAWEVNDCGEQTGNPAIDGARDIPTCVEADVSLDDGRVLSVMIAVGTVQKGVSGEPSLFSVLITGSSKPVGGLSRIPAELHPLPSPRRPVRDLSLPPSAPGA